LTDEGNYPGDLDDLQQKIGRARQSSAGGAQEVAVGMGLVFTLGLTVALCLMIGDSSGRWLVDRFAVKALYPVTMVASVLVAFGSGYRQIRFFTRAMEKGQK
jgi:hypothetical protein